MSSSGSSFLRYFVLCALLSCVHGAEVNITPIPGGDGAYTQVTVASQTAWQNTGTSRYLYGRRPDSFAFTAGQTLYVRVTYFDDAEGVVDLQYDSQTSSTTTSSLHTRTSRVGSGLFVNGYFELSNVLFNKRQNGSSDFRIICGTSTGAKVPVQRITLSDTPFADPDFQLAVSRAWRTRYTGPAKDYVDRTTLKGKVMTGYQGWFGTPNDIADTRVWRHWARNGVMIPENFTIDAWPDLTEYDPASLIRAANVMTTSGDPAYLFSSRTYSAVQKHFRWMRKHNVDGAWVQRFHPQAGASSEWVLRNVSQAAAEEGLVWGVEYDVSGMADATVFAKLQADWVWLTTQFDILNDPRYIREDGKPVVFIWGFPFPDRNFTTASADAAVDWFKAQGVHVIGGIPSNWNTLSASWKTHIEKYDGVLSWMNTNIPDATFFRNRGQDFYPHIWPGFSWAHLKQLPATPLDQYTDRSGGQFFWSKGREWINAGATDSLFFGMWDEYDEATHIMPKTDNHPPPHTEWGRFVNNQGKPSDWWMMLCDELKRMMLGQRANTNTLPTVATLANRSNIGAEASADLGAADISSFLTRVENGDGNTTVETVDGKECRGNASPSTTHRYMYFRVNDSFAFQLASGDVTLEVEYYDSFYGAAAGTVLGLQYDGAGATYTNYPQSITTTNSNTWRTVRFELADAYFGNRQNGSSDFRLNFNSKKLNINRVWVRLPEGKAYPFTWTNATSGPALNWTLNGNWLGGIVGQSDPTSIVRFFPGQSMTGGTIPISNNLSGQVFNQLQLGGTASSSADTIVTLSGNALSLAGTAPAITQDALKSIFDLTYDVVVPISLSGMTQVNGAGTANLRISGAIDGIGGLNKVSAASLTLSGASTFTGGVTLQAGTLNINAAGVADTSGPLGNGGTLILNGGIIDNTSGSAKILANVNSIVVGGDFQFGTAGGTSANHLTLPGGVNLGGATRTVTTNGAGILTFSGTVSNGGLVKTRSGQLILGGANTYGGNLTVNAGLIRLSNAPDPANANPGNDASTVTIAATGATLDLTYTGTDKVTNLIIGTTPMADGIYGKTGSASPVIGIPQITGNGTLTVSAPGFSSWITNIFANGQVPLDKRGPNDDPDNDGIRNLVEYAIALQDPTVPDPTIGSFTTTSLSFSKRSGTSGLTYAIQESTDLGVADTWGEVSGSFYTNNTSTISYSFSTGGTEKNFLRLQVFAD